MTTRTRSALSSDAAASPRKLKQQKVWDVTPSELSQLCANPIRKIVDNIKKPENADKALIPLSLGDPTVFGNFKCPDVLVESIVRNVRSMKHNGYIHSAGSEEAREAIAKKYGSESAPLTKEDVIIASGGSGALDIALTGLLNPGDNILLPKPGFPLYQVICETHKIECKFYNLDPENNWEADLEHMQSLVDKNTKAILVNNPSNPCGSVYSKPHLEKILALAELNKLPIISDEIYGDMTFGANLFYPLAALTKTVPVIAVSGLAKHYLIPGWRVGWVLVNDRNNILKDVRTAYFKLSQLILGSNSLVQSAIPDLLTPAPGSAEADSLAEFKARYFSTLEKNSKFTTDALSKIRGLKVVVPQGAMYVMVGVDTTILTGIKDDFDFTQKLLDEESVFVLPGQCFGMTNYFRIVFAAPHEVLSDAYARLASFCKRHQSVKERTLSGIFAHSTRRLSEGDSCVCACVTERREEEKKRLDGAFPRLDDGGGDARDRAAAGATRAFGRRRSGGRRGARARQQDVQPEDGRALLHQGRTLKLELYMTYEYAVSDAYYDLYSKKVIAENLKGLDFNTLRVYNINPDESYKNFMTDMAALGVYVLVSASPDNDEYFGKYRYSTITKALGPDGKVSTSSNGAKTVDQTETCYPALLLEYGKKIAKNFAAYDNTLGIIVANEIMQIDLTAAACVKQYVADLKNWMRVNGKKMRILPLAYAAADSSYAGKIDNADDYHVLKVQGLLCGDKMKDGSMQKSIDIYLINEYRWCPKSTFAEAYQRLINFAQGIPIAIAFGEYGCKEDAAVPRDWGMVPYLYGKPTDTKLVSEVYSGGLAYSYGQAKLAPDAKFPMFTGGSQDPLKQPSTTASVDYTNLKSSFVKNTPYSDKAEWTSSTTCTWAPTLATTTQASNTRATTNGWIPDSCTASYLKVADTDTWVAKSREGIVCDDSGGKCDVTVPDKVGTTEEDLCGTYEVASGGDVCKVSSDCGENGQCLTVNGEKQCSCLTCYTGSDCSVKDISTCSTLASSKDAPKIVFVGVGAFLGIMLVVFIVLGVIAQKKKSAMDKLGNQVKLRAPGAAPVQGATL